MLCHIRSLYLCVTDMERAICFYEELLEQHVTVRDPLYSVFDVEGFRLGLFAFEKAGEQHHYGENCLPSIDFPDLDTLRRKLMEKRVVFPLRQIGSNWVSEIADSEGNHIELTAPVKDATKC